MSTRVGRPSGRGLAIAAALALGLALLVPAPASAASVRLQVWDFNACDQYGRAFPDCQVTPTQRASAIVQSVTTWPANVVTLQELCRSTFDMVVASLPPGWVSAFFSTFTTTDTRCQSADPTWGIAVLARSSAVSAPSTYTLGVESSGERRTLLCVDVTVAIGMRTCTTHLTSSSQATAANQARTAVGLVNQWVAANRTVVVGGDFNLNVRQCANSNVSTGLGPWYSGRFGAGSSRCYSGSGSMHEADRYRLGGDGVYDEDTEGSSKLDYVFANRQHVNNDYAGDATSSSVSDHDPLRGAFTAHD